VSLDRRTVTSLPQRSRATFFSLVGRDLDHVYHFVRHRLAHAEAVGDLLPGELTPEDVVDAALLRAYREFLRTPPAGKLRSWLIGIARETLTAQIHRQQSWRERTPRRIEEHVPETPPTEEVSTLGDEVLDFYEPDERLKLEDVIADMDVATPEEGAESRELQRCVDASLAMMPEAWRRVVQLRYVDGLGAPEIARNLGRPETEVRRTLDHARHYLRQKLVESGCTLKTEGLEGQESHG
jgi:RNA polymerase sigma factor (sigma-70 family)